MTFAEEIARAKQLLKNAPLVRSQYWQGVDTSNKPEMSTKEVLNHTLRAESTALPLNNLIAQIQPDLPWANDHFEERVSRKALNPPPSEAWWPYAPSGNSQFKKEGQFSHTYPERYWPKNAGLQPYFSSDTVRRGIRFPYGDLDNLVDILTADPNSRQAYLPVWFPEDLGAPITERKPCTLGYQFIIRNNELHVIYFIRSCDFVRHFRNDIYLTIKLQRWVLEELKLRVDYPELIPGSFTMHITSLHLFINDYYQLFKGEL